MSWQATATEVLRTIDPHEAAPLYVLDADHVAKQLSANVFGCWSPTLDIVCRQHLVDARQWRGRGFCCLVNAAQVTRLTSDTAEQVAIFIGIALHEYIHYLMAPPREVELSSAELEAIAVEYPRAVAAMTAHKLEFHLSCLERPYIDHDYRFGRYAYHLLHRYCRSRFAREYPLCLNHIWHRKHYGFHSTNLLAGMLAEECDLLKHEPLRAIADRPMTEAYRLRGEWELAEATKVYDHFHRSQQGVKERQELSEHAEKQTQ